MGVSIGGGIGPVRVSYRLTGGSSTKTSGADGIAAAIGLVFGIGLGMGLIFAGAFSFDTTDTLDDRAFDRAMSAGFVWGGLMCAFAAAALVTVWITQWVQRRRDRYAPEVNQPGPIATLPRPTSYRRSGRPLPTPY